MTPTTPITTESLLDWLERHLTDLSRAHGSCPTPCTLQILTGFVQLTLRVSEKGYKTYMGQTITSALLQAKWEIDK